MKTLINAVMGTLLLGGATASNAALYDRGNGLIYDDILDITWLQDARLAESNTFGVSDINADGSMTWDNGFNWIAAMNSANYKGFHNWRMPTLEPVNGSSLQYTVSYDGSTDRGFNNYATNNELTHLFYASLGNLGHCSSSNAVGTPSDDCQTNPNGTWGLQNTGPFVNFLVGRYFTSTHDTRPDEERAFDLDANFGQVGTGSTAGAKFVWAVIDGDIARLTAVPVPAAAWLLGSGILGLVSFGRRKFG